MSVFLDQQAQQQQSSTHAFVFLINNLDLIIDVLKVTMIIIVIIIILIEYFPF